MTDIFVSYAREDRSRVEPLVRTLEARGYSVWWDRELVPGSSFEKVIDEAISAAQCVMVVWTRRSVDSEWVQAEAGDGLERGILVPVMMDAVRVPISFRRKHAAQLLEWPRRHDELELEFLLRGVAQCIAREPTPVTDAPSSHMSGPVPRGSGPRSKLITAVSVALLIATAFLLYQLLPATALTSGSGVAGSGVADSGIADHTLAVIPFVNPDAAEVTSSADVQAQSQIAYEIAHRLGRIKDLKVISDEAVLGMLAQGHLDEIRRKLKVNYLIEGTLPNEASTGPITISLVNTLSGATLWTETFETERDRLSSIVSTIANRVARSLELSVPEDSQTGRIPEGAYLAYLKGRAELRKPHTGQARAAARAQFERAIALAPQFSEAFAGLCQAYIHDYEITASTHDFETAEGHCHRALTLDLNNNEVHIALGYLFRYSGQYERALGNYRTVLANAPFNADALRGMGVTYWDMGLAEKAEQRFKLLIEIEPGFWENYQKLGNLYFNMGRFGAAAANYEIQSSLVRIKPVVLNNLAAAYYLAEQFDRAVDAWETALALEPSSTTYANLGSAHFFLENFRESAEMYERAVEAAPNDHRTWGNAAEAYYFTKTKTYVAYYTKAIELANAQLAINPSDHSTLSRVATYHSAVGHADDAIGALGKARALNEEDVYVVYDAAIVYSRLDRKADAEQALGELIALGYSKRLISMDANFRNFTHVLEEKKP